LILNSGLDLGYRLGFCKEVVMLLTKDIFIVKLKTPGVAMFEP